MPTAHKLQTPKTANMVLEEMLQDLLQRKSGNEARIVEVVELHLDEFIASCLRDHTELRKYLREAACTELHTMKKDYAVKQLRKLSIQEQKEAAKKWDRREKRLKEATKTFLQKGIYKKNDKDLDKKVAGNFSNLLNCSDVEFETELEDAVSFHKNRHNRKGQVCALNGTVNRVEARLLALMDTWGEQFKVQGVGRKQVSLYDADLEDLEASRKQFICTIQGIQTRLDFIDYIIQILKTNKVSRCRELAEPIRVKIAEKAKELGLVNMEEED